MQSTVDTVQPEQWSWMLTQLWSWMWSGMSWILDLQHLMFGFIFVSGLRNHTRMNCVAFSAYFSSPVK